MSRPLAALLTILALLAVPLAPAGSAPGRADTSYDARIRGWDVATPAAADFRAKRLAWLARQAKRRNSTCFAVVRDGRLVRDWNWLQHTRDTPREVFSVTKSVTATLIGIAARDGDLKVSDRASKYIPRWRKGPSRHVTIRHLLSNSSGRFWSFKGDYGRLFQARNRTKYAVGLRQQYAPGATWAYNNAAIQTLDLILRRATGMATDDFAQRRLFGPLGMRNTSMTRDPSGRSTNTYFGLRTTCLDIAKFARLYLQRGRLGERRILSKAFVRAATGRSSTAHAANYGYLWWLNRPGILRGATDRVDRHGQPLDRAYGKLAPRASERAFAALGFGGQTVLVDPGSRTIVARLGIVKQGVHYTFEDATRVVTWAQRRR